MHEVVVVEHVSLDGVMQAPARADEDARGGFSRGGWAGPLGEADPSLPHPASHRVLGEAATTVADPKATGDGALVVMGSGALVHALAAAGPVDRYVLCVLPVVLGTGLRLLPDGGAPATLEVEWLEATPAGASVGSYRVA